MNPSSAGVNARSGGIIVASQAETTADAHRRSGETAPARMPEELAGRPLSGVATIIFAAAGVLATLLAINQQLNLQLFVGVVFIENRYLFLLAASLFPLVFLTFPAFRSAAEHTIPWYDWLLSVIAAGLLCWFAWQAEHILEQGWEYNAPPLGKIFAGILWLLLLEGLRRSSGTTMTVIVGLVSLYPVVAELIPNPFKGNAQTLTDTLAYHLISTESAFGIPMRAFAEIVVGFIIFGVALNHTGGGRFFNDLAFSLVGRLRGGAAQVGIISSALQGSISGSVISNVISSGEIGRASCRERV